MIWVYSSISWAIAGSLISLFLAPHASADCFYPNGTSRNRNVTGAAAPYQPCYSGVSMCCSTAFDSCRRDGLCFDGTNLWRESCTDQTWKSPDCIKLCVSGLDEAGNYMNQNDEHVTQCPDLSYCCGIEQGAKDCCANGEGLWIVNGTATNVNPSSTTSAGATPTSASPSPATSTGSSGSSKNTGPIVGGVVGGIAGLVFIATAAWFWWRRREARDYSDPRANTEPPFHEQEKPAPVKGSYEPVDLVEAPENAQLHEMDTRGNKPHPAELQ